MIVLTLRVIPAGEGASLVLTRQPGAPEDPQVLGRHDTPRQALIDLLGAYNGLMDQFRGAVVATRMEYGTHRMGRAWGKATVTLDVPAGTAVRAS